MQQRHVVGLIAATITLAAPVAATAGSASDRATGGGQVLLGTQGAGNTIAFTAQGTPQAAKGQVQVVDRTAGRGQDQVKFHGIVDCLVVEGNAAELAGRDRDGKPFTLYVVDNGEGANASQPDVIALDRTTANPECDGESNDEDLEMDLARGNAQVYDAP